MAPIRTALVGLSASARSSWAVNAHLPYLLSPRGRSKYQIVALCNTSVEAARNAIDKFNLPKETKAYGDPDSLANDKDVELVVVCTRVDVHYETALPSIKAGKKIYVEWPLAQDVSHAEELLNAAKESGSHGIVGLQGRLSPSAQKLRELVRQGRIGKVLSSEVHASGGSNDRDLIPATMKYFTQKAIGGNVVTIGFAHVFDPVQHVIGEIGNFKSQLQIQRPNVRIRDPVTNKVIETVKSDVPDLVFATGTLSDNEISNEGASVLFRFRRGQPFPGEPALTWKINGEKGEIRFISQSTTALQFSPNADSVKIEVHDFETDKVESVPWGWPEWQEELPVAGRSIGAVYDKFAEGDTQDLLSFSDAVLRHRQLAEIWKEY